MSNVVRMAHAPLHRCSDVLTLLYENTEHQRLCVSGHRSLRRRGVSHDLSSTSLCTLTVAQEVKATPVCRDPDADELLALAMAAQADLIIHSDAKLKT